MVVNLAVDKEIIEVFQTEANGLLEELRTIIDKLEQVKDSSPKELLQEFANKTDRIMGTSDTFSVMHPDELVFQQIGKFAALCKATGYKASALNHPGLLVIFAAFWGDTVDILQDLVDNVGEPEKIKEVMSAYGPVLQKRLVWLAQKIVTITKGTPSETQGQINVDGLLEKLGIKT
jgi:hypothetical protein